MYNEGYADGGVGSASSCTTVVDSLYIKNSHRAVMWKHDCFTSYFT